MMSAARLTAGMLTQSYQWYLHSRGGQKKHAAPPHTRTVRTPCFKRCVQVGWLQPITECLLCFGFVFEEKVDPTPWPPFLLGLRACQTYVIQEIPLLGPSGVTIATGTRTCRCRPSPARSRAHARRLPLPLYCLEAFVMTVGGIGQCCPEVVLYRRASCCEEVHVQTHRVALGTLQNNLITRDCLRPQHLIIQLSFSCCYAEGTVGNGKGG